MPYNYQYNSRMKISTLLLLITGLIWSSCINDPQFPSQPRIALNGLNFYEIGGNNEADSLQVIISFEDGEGDLGLGSDEKSNPYNLHNYYNNKTGQVIDFTAGPVSSDILLTYADRATIDSLPPFTEPFTCTRWTTTPELFLNDSTKLQDTVYFQFNPRHNNFFVEFMIKRNGNFEKFDFRQEFDCSVTYDGRFPLIQKGNKNNPKEGTITYNMQSRFFLAFFDNETLKLRIRILDRAGNYSNFVETPEFTLQGIQAN